jgi:hypothetical protein
MKKEIRKTTATIAATVCLSLCALSMAAMPPITAMMNETTEMRFLTCPNLLCLSPRELAHYARNP